MTKTKQDQSIILFNQKQIRRHWDDKNELWYFSIIDVISILTESPRPRKYWSDLKNKLKKEGSELSAKIGQLKMLSSDGKKYLTDAGDTETILRLIQSIPSPKAEPLKLWLAKVGYDRIEETEDPELAINRAMQTYLKKGYTKEWINQRLKSIEIRKELTDEWQERGLRDNMTNLELILNMLAEASTKEISEKKQPKGLKKNKRVARQGGTVAKKARNEIEKRTGKSVISRKNAKQLQQAKSQKHLNN